MSLSSATAGLQLAVWFKPTKCVLWLANYAHTIMTPNHPIESTGAHSGSASGHGTLLVASPPACGVCSVCHKVQLHHRQASKQRPCEVRGGGVYKSQLTVSTPCPVTGFEGCARTILCSAYEHGSTRLLSRPWLDSTLLLATSCFRCASCVISLHPAPWHPHVQPLRTTVPAPKQLLHNHL